MKIKSKVDPIDMIRKDLGLEMDTSILNIKLVGAGWWLYVSSNT